jgi:hypothetical protein
LTPTLVLTVDIEIISRVEDKLASHFSTNSIHELSSLELLKPTASVTHEFINAAGGAVDKGLNLIQTGFSGSIIRGSGNAAPVCIQIDRKVFYCGYCWSFRNDVITDGIYLL